MTRFERIFPTTGSSGSHMSRLDTRTLYALFWLLVSLLAITTLGA